MKIISVIFIQTSNILTKRRIASVEAMFPSSFQLQQIKYVLGDKISGSSYTPG